MIYLHDIAGKNVATMNYHITSDFVREKKCVAMTLCRHDDVCKLTPFCLEIHCKQDTYKERILITPVCLFHGINTYWVPWKIFCTLCLGALCSKSMMNTASESLKARKVFIYQHFSFFMSI